MNNQGKRFSRLVSVTLEATNCTLQITNAKHTAGY